MEAFGAAQATFIFIAANVVISVIGFLNPRFLEWGLLTTQGVIQKKEYHRILVSGFLHGGPIHLLVNMLTLFFFGPYMESVIGSDRFYLVYLISLVGGSMLALYRNANNPAYAALGASGAVSGVLFSFCLFEPLQLIFIFGLIPIPAILFSVLYVLYSIYGMGQEDSRIGHDAHLGGAITGVAITILLVPEAVGRFLSEIGGIF